MAIFKFIKSEFIFVERDTQNPNVLCNLKSIQVSSATVNEALNKTKNKIRNFDQR